MVVSTLIWKHICSAFVMMSAGIADQHLEQSISQSFLGVAKWKHSDSFISSLFVSKTILARIHLKRENVNLFKPVLFLVSVTRS